MITQIFPSLGPFATNGYIAVCTKTGQTAIIDAPPDSFDPISLYLKEKSYTPTVLLLTHSHLDHIADAQRWKEEYPILLYIHPSDLPNLEHPGSDGLPSLFYIPPAKADVLLEEKMVISIGSLHFRVIHTPGHSPGSVCFYEPNHGILFTGDTLFKGSIGNLSFPTSQPNLMEASLQKFLLLPSDVTIYPGHGPSSTIKKEATWIPRAKQLFGF